MSWEMLEPDNKPARADSGARLTVSAFGRRGTLVTRLTLHGDVLDELLFGPGDTCKVELGTRGAAGKLRVAQAEKSGRFELKAGRGKASTKAVMILPSQRLGYPAGFKADLDWSVDQGGGRVLTLPPLPDAEAEG